MKKYNSVILFIICTEFYWILLNLIDNQSEEIINRDDNNGGINMKLLFDAVKGESNGINHNNIINKGEIFVDNNNINVTLIVFFMNEIGGEILHANENISTILNEWCKNWCII